MLTRRQTLAALPAMAAAGAPDERPLRDIAAARGLTFGTAVTVADLADPALAALVSRECAMVTPALEAKWAATEPGDGRFTFESFDRVAGFAVAHRLALHLHTLIWAVYLPSWVGTALADGRGEAVMARHISAVARRHAGQVTLCDVVNEPVDPRWPSDADGLCTTPWWHALGPGYVADAFRYANEALPGAVLMINDDDLEYEGADRDLKRVRYLRLIERLLAARVPISGFGLECHIKPWWPIDERAYRRFLAELAGFGLTLAITEFDVCDRDLPAPDAARDTAVAEIARRFLDLALDERAVRSITCWGLSDRSSWMSRDPDRRRADGLASRPLPYDAHLDAKPMRRAIALALAHAPARG